jgi:hypothetical protein
MKFDGRKAFAVFVTLIFLAPLLGLFFQNPSITGAATFTDTVGGFKDTNRTVVYKNDSLVIWFFGTTTCSHCTWEKEVLKDVLQGFENVTLKDYYLDSNYDQSRLTVQEVSMIQEYDPEGYVPLMVIGNKYFKVGSGESNGYDQEKQHLTQLIRSLV